MKFKLLFTLMLFIYSEYSFAQTNVRREWQNNSNISFTDVEYNNESVYDIGKFTHPTVTIGGNMFTTNGGSDIVTGKMGSVLLAKRECNDDSEFELRTYSI